MWLYSVIAITNSNGNSASPWKTTPRIFTSAKFFLPAIYSTLQLFMVSSMTLMTSSEFLYILRQLFHTLRVFHARWSFTGVWPTVYLLKFPGFFSVFQPILKMLWLKWSRFVFEFPSLLSPVGWNWWIQRLLFCRGVSPHASIFLDMTLNSLMVRLQ